MNRRMARVEKDLKRFHPAAVGGVIIPPLVHIIFLCAFTVARFLPDFISLPPANVILEFISLCLCDWYQHNFISFFFSFKIYVRQFQDAQFLLEVIYFFF